jgi:hypothetical protein
VYPSLQANILGTKAGHKDGRGEVVLLFSSDREEGLAERGSSIPAMSRAHDTKAGFSSMMAMSTTTKRKRRGALVGMELTGNNKSGSAMRS